MERLFGYAIIVITKNQEKEVYLLNLNFFIIVPFCANVCAFKN